MKCFYCLAPALMSTRQVSDDPHAAGLSDFFIHFVSKDESGLKQHHRHSSSYLETLDVVRSGFIGAGLSFVAGLAGIELLRYFEPFGPDVPALGYPMLVAVATLFGAWDGGLIGVGAQDSKLARFRDVIASGRCLKLIYVFRRKDREGPGNDE